MNDQWSDRLSEYLDDELSEVDRAALEAHLQTCRSCSTTLGDLRRVVRRARLLREQEPAHDLWPGIARRIGATPHLASDVRSPNIRPGERRRWSFSLPQLAAAGIAIMTVSGGAVWLLQEPASPTVVVTVDSASPELPATTVALRPDASQSYAAAVADLERVLAAGRGRLDSTTVRVIEQNLAAIDRAIAQAQRALEADSANLYLNSHLAQTMRRKLDLLRQAAALVPVS
jgi:predicted anti-sigma-YlaC factor YlaD